MKPLGKLLPPKGRASAVDVSALVASLPGIAQIARGRWAFDTGEGRNVQIVVNGQGVKFSGAFDPTRRYDEEHGAWTEDDDANAPLYEAVEALARPLQRVTRWPLELSNGDEVSAETPCARCDTRCFEWEDECPRCHADLSGPLESAPADDDDRWARRVIEALLRDGLIELDTRRKESVVSVLAAHFGNFGSAADEVSDLLVEHPAVEEVFCDDERLAQVIRESRAPA